METVGDYFKGGLFYFLLAGLGGALGLILGASYGGNYGFDWPLLPPGYEGAGILGFWLGAILFVSLRILYKLKYQKVKSKLTKQN